MSKTVPLLCKGLIIPFPRSSGLVSKSEMTVNKSTNELTTGSPPNFKHSFGISSMPLDLPEWRRLTIFSIFLFTKFYQNWRIYGHFIIRERPFNLKGGVMVFLFRSEFFFRTTQVRIFFPEFNIRLYDKNSESDYFFFLHQNQNIFFSNIGNQNIFLEKEPWFRGVSPKVHWSEGSLVRRSISPKVR